MAINNPGTNSVFEGVKAINANSIVHGIDVFGSSAPIGNFYITESGDFYVTEDGLNNYVPES